MAVLILIVLRFRNIFEEGNFEGIRRSLKAEVFHSLVYHWISSISVTMLRIQMSETGSSVSTL